MSILSTHNLTVSFGDFDLFQGISVNIANNSKIGLIGPKGVGKSTLLKIMTGIRPPTTGSVHIARRRRLGYLRQEAVDAFAARENSVYAEMLTVFSDIIKQQNQLHQMEAKMAADNHQPVLLERYGELQHAFEQAGGYEYNVHIQRTLTGLGLGEQYWDTPLSHLSGGQKTRALLARLLLEKPDLLMLDEPTNHLDIDAIEWFEQTLTRWEGAILVVSHDRFFLDNTVSAIWQMTPVGIKVYSGNYSDFLLQRDEKWEYYQRVFKEEKAHRIDKFLGTRNALFLIPLGLAVVFSLESQYVFKFGFFFIFLQSFVSGPFHPLVNDYINKKIPSSKRATVLSIKNMVNSLLFIILSPIIGYYIDLYSLTTTLVIMGVGLALLSLVFFVLYQRVSTPIQQSVAS